MKRASILVIDDEQIIGNLLKDVLSERGYEVTYADDPKSGMALAKENEYDIYIVDLKMPHIDGIEVMRNIKSSHPDAVIVVQTGFGTLETAQEALRIGAYDYITKPFDIEKLAFTVAKAHSFRRLTSENRELLQRLEKDKVELEKRVRDTARDLALIYQIGRDISSSLELADVLRYLVERITSILNLETCVILLVEKETGDLVVKAAQGVSREDIEKTRLKSGEYISGYVLKERKSIIIEDINKDPLFATRTKEKYYHGSFISVPLIVMAKKEGEEDRPIGVINIANKKSGEKFDLFAVRLLEEVAIEAAIAIDNARLYTSLEDTYIRTVMSLTSAIDAKDHYTRSHSENVTDYALAIAAELELSNKEIEHIKKACQLHDLGKIGIHDHILTKPGKLNPQEWEEMKSHSMKGVEILEPLHFLGDVIELIREHHERFDGTGYPDGTKGEKIPLGARIIAVGDAFDAMISERPYHKPRSIEDAKKELKNNSGTQFDPKVVEAFLRVLEKQPDIISYSGENKEKPQAQK
ncbi:MAG: hypothetical protein DRP74_05240 [Candidatus Omnitrophota bacterium]|nr:MAG: hypothetical protein DRP74_05240 [Candidatus Omnitrophota bacterium]